MKCANCGFVMPGGAKYCPACGHEVCNAEYQSDDYIQEKDEDFEKKSDYLPIKNTVTYEKLCLAAGLVVFAAGIQASILGKWLCTVVCCVQAAGLAYGFLVHKRLFSGHPRQRKYISAAVSFGLSAVYISLFVFTGSGLYEKDTGDTFVLPAPARVQPTAIKGYEYIWVADKYTLYTANVLSDTSVKIQKYKRDEPGRYAEYTADVATVKTVEEESFSFLDSDTTTFVLTLPDEGDGTAVFTVNTAGQDRMTGSGCNRRIACYTRQSDDWHCYRAWALTDRLVKIECWCRESSDDEFYYGWDVGVADTYSAGFEWTDDSRTSFLLEIKDAHNPSRIDNGQLGFELENPDYRYACASDYLKSKQVGPGQAAVPGEKYDFLGENYRNIYNTLTDAGFTNITLTPVYDIILGIFATAEDVESLTVDGYDDYEQGEVFDIDVPIVITYHMPASSRPEREGQTSSQPGDNSALSRPESQVSERPSQRQPLTPDNCPQLKEMLENKADMDDSYGDFARKYAGQTIEFDGRIDYCTKHGNYNTRFDYLVSAGDYDPDSQTGPSFKFENVNYYDLNTDLDIVSVGLNVKITAQVVRYDTGSGLFYLKPISVKSR